MLPFKYDLHYSPKIDHVFDHVFSGAWRVVRSVEGRWRGTGFLGSHMSDFVLHIHLVEKKTIATNVFPFISSDFQCASNRSTYGNKSSSFTPDIFRFF